jgi:hypothetical protein
MELIFWNITEWILYGLLVVFGIALLAAFGSFIRILFEVARDGWRAGQGWLLRWRASLWWRS